MKDTSKFWNKVAQKYAKKSVPDEAIYQQKLKLTHDVLKADMRVLEVACGTGSTALNNSPKVASYIATDSASKMIQIAQGKLDKSDVTNLEFKVANITESLYGHQGVDAILAHSVLHLLNNPAEIIEEVCKALKPGGYFIASVPRLEGKLRLMQPLFSIGAFLGVIPHVTFFNKSDLQLWLKLAGFDVINHWVPDKSPGTSFIIAQKTP